MIVTPFMCRNNCLSSGREFDAYETYSNITDNYDLAKITVKSVTDHQKGT